MPMDMMPYSLMKRMIFEDMESTIFAVSVLLSGE